MIRGLLRRSTPRNDDCGWNSPTHTDLALISELRKNSRVRVGVARLATALTINSLTVQTWTSPQQTFAAGRGYGPAELVAASCRSEGCLEHSTR
jgi:hypothetical protein